MHLFCCSVWTGSVFVFCHKEEVAIKIFKWGFGIVQEFALADIYAALAIKVLMNDFANPKNSEILKLQMWGLNHYGLPGPYCYKYFERSLTIYVVFDIFQKLQVQVYSEIVELSVH